MELQAAPGDSGGLLIKASRLAFHLVDSLMLEFGNSPAGRIARVDVNMTGPGNEPRRRFFVPCIKVIRSYKTCACISRVVTPITLPSSLLSFLVFRSIISLGR